MSPRLILLALAVTLIAGTIAWSVFRSPRVAVAAMIVVGLAATSEHDLRGTPKR